MEMQHTRNPAEGEVLVSVDRKLTPVYAVTVPTKGLSGAIRRRAYKIHEHKARRWLFLMLADRIDVIESGIADLVKRRPASFITGLLAVVGTVAAVRLLRAAKAEG